LLLDRTAAGSGFFRTAFFLPTITSIIAIAVVWLWVYDDANGLANMLLRLVGLKPVRWLTSPKTSLLSLIIMTVWKNAGYHMVVFLAGLQAIPPSLHEAATIDGASPRQRFRYVTWPLLAPTTVFVLVTNTIFTFQVFGPIYVMTGGGPVRSTSVIVYYLYQRAFEFQEMGYASAVAWVIFLILIALTVLQMRLARKREQVW
ncbi:MAG: sugar ABC transporter permease, partial [Spirochaetes bacterium GWB1_66_5]